MGQKVNPISFRIQTNNAWRSRWFAGREYARYLHEDFQIRAHINKKLERAGISRVIIERTGRELVVTVFTSKPGMIIGRGGSGIEELRADLTKISQVKGLRLNVEEVRNPEVDAQLVARNIAGQLERRIAFRRALRQSAERTIRAGAKGIRIQIAGRLGGAEMSRRETTARGSIPLHTLRADIDYASALAKTTYGVIGVKVWINKGNVFDKEATEEAR
jgi:small subunit ribosomal protein S3